MGKHGGEIRGRTKVSTWLKFLRERRRILNRWDLQEDSPIRKRFAYKEMQRDTTTGEWVLPYHFS
jgi:hypothetical protein